MKTSEKITLAAVLCSYLGFQVLRAKLKADSSSVPVMAGNGFHSEGYAQLTIACKHNITEQEFRAIRMGMDYAQLLDSVNVVQHKTLKESMPNPEGYETHVVFESPNKSSVEVVFRQDRVAHKERHSSYENSLKEGDGTE
jgi:hypothetical protein